MIPIPSGRVFYFLGVLLSATAFVCEYGGENFDGLKSVLIPLGPAFILGGAILAAADEIVAAVRDRRS